LNNQPASWQWFVSLDLEMTGVDPETDEIIEIGAVRFAPDGRTERFQSLVNPGRTLSYRIQTLTGIHDDELQSAPPLAVVSGALRAFLGSYPIVGQHVAFDLLYLAKHGIRPTGPVFNTAEIAELLSPGEAEYSLRALTRRLCVDFPVQHRALGDAEAAMDVFRKLRGQAADIDPLILDEVVQLTADSSWPLRFFFSDVERSSPRRVPERPDSGIVLDLTAPDKSAMRALTPVADRVEVSPEEVGCIFDEVQRQPAVYHGFEQRPQQIEMAQAVALALNQDTNLLVEAGTGTGKSLAYLLPAACFALRNNERVVVSTSTISLQEQIIGKDVPAMQRVLETCGPEDIRQALPDFRAVPLKGRGNYICLQKFATFRRQGLLTSDEARFAAKLLLWLLKTETGDRSELNLRGEEENLWPRVSAANVNCFAGPTYYVRNGSCQLMRARKRAENAHLVVVNHALLLSDIAAGGRVLPTYDRIIVDEAHNLEDEATSQFGFRTGQTELRNALSAIFDRTAEREHGLVTDIRLALPSDDDTLQQEKFIRGLLDAVAGQVDRARERVPEIFGRLHAFTATHGESGGDYDNRLLITASKRAQPEWEHVEIAWDNLRIALDAVNDGLSRLLVALSETSSGIAGHENLASQLQTQSLDLARLTRGVDAVILRHDEERIAWLTVNRQFGTTSLASAPLNVGEVLESYLFGRKSSVILTSATLSTAGNFKYVRNRLGLEEVDELALGSPFDYKRSALVLMPEDMPEPNRLDYQPALESAIVDLVRASAGRALVLFTSHSALRTAYYAIKAQLVGDGIRVMAQGIDGAPDDLLEALRTDRKTVLLGTSSFWEGVDVAGEALSLLIIAKLPFSVPSDPVFAARSELFTDPFKDFALPQSVLRFKQGFGRLIRHRNDRGVLVVLDRRVRSKAYGRAFLQSLPDCSSAEAPLGQLSSLVRQWLKTPQT